MLRRAFATLAVSASILPGCASQYCQSGAKHGTECRDPDEQYTETDDDEKRKEPPPPLAPEPDYIRK